MTSPSEANAQGASIPEAVITIHQDLGNAGRILFSLDLHMEANPTSETLFNCDLVALTLFNLARTSAPAFNETYLKVVACINAMTQAQLDGADAAALAAIRDQHGIAFRAE